MADRTAIPRWHRVERRALRWLTVRLAQRGQQLLIVADSEAGEMRHHLYSLRVTLAADRWANRPADVGLKDWQRAMARSGRIPARFMPGQPAGQETAGAPDG